MPQPRRLSRNGSMNSVVSHFGTVSAATAGSMFRQHGVNSSRGGGAAPSASNNPRNLLRTFSFRDKPPNPDLFSSMPCLNNPIGGRLGNMNNGNGNGIALPPQVVPGGRLNHQSSSTPTSSSLVLNSLAYQVLPIYHNTQQQQQQQQHRLVSKTTSAVVPAPVRSPNNGPVAVAGSAGSSNSSSSSNLLQHKTSGSSSMLSLSSSGGTQPVCSASTSVSSNSSGGGDGGGGGARSSGSGASASSGNNNGGSTSPPLLQQQPKQQQQAAQQQQQQQQQALLKPVRRPVADDADGHLAYLPGDVLGERYEVESSLGEGTFGKVARCKDLRTGQFVATKIIKNIHKYREAAKLEVNVLRKLNAKDPHGR